MYPLLLVIGNSWAFDDVIAVEELERSFRWLLSRIQQITAKMFFKSPGLPARDDVRCGGLQTVNSAILRRSYRANRTFCRSERDFYCRKRRNAATRTIVTSTKPTGPSPMRE